MLAFGPARRHSHSQREDWEAIELRAGRESRRRRQRNLRGAISVARKADHTRPRDAHHLC
jgi:hypothetical protein